jgi:hypothetical protein
MHSKIPTSDWGWDLPISNTGFRASGLHVFVKYVPPTASGHSTDSDKRFFQLLMPRSTPVSLLESAEGLALANQLADTGKRRFLYLWSIVLLSHAEYSIQNLRDSRQKQEVT